MPAILNILLLHLLFYSISKFRVILLASFCFYSVFPPLITRSTPLSWKFRGVTDTDLPAACLSLPEFELTSLACELTFPTFEPTSLECELTSLVCELTSLVCKLTSFPPTLQLQQTSNLTTNQCACSVRPHRKSTICFVLIAAYSYWLIDRQRINCRFCVVLVIPQQFATDCSERHLWTPAGGVAPE
jgi:hypothetical protein